jgi:hypothetical protein
MNSKLIVSGVQLDLSDNIAVPLNLSISDVKEPEKRKRSYSKSIKLEGTSNNMQFFLSAYSLSMDIINSSNVSFDPAIRNPCEFYKNDLLIFKGKLKLNEVIIQDKNYYFDCTLFSDAVDIFSKLKDKKLNELDWSEYDHTLTVTNIVNSWRDSVYINGVSQRNFGSDFYGYQPKSYGYIYPLVDYGFQKPNNSEITFRTNQLYPFIYVKEALQKTLDYALRGENIQIDYTTSFFTNENMKRLIYGYGGGEQLKLNSEQANKMKIDIDGGIPTKTKTGTAKYIPVGNQNVFQGYLFGITENILKSISFDTTPIYELNTISTIDGSITINAAGTYDINLSTNFSFTYTGDGSNKLDTTLDIEVDGVVVQTYNWNQNKDASVNVSVKTTMALQVGQKIKFNFYFGHITKTDNTLDYTFTSTQINLTAKETIVDNSPISLNTTIPDIKCSDFLKGIINLFYAYMSDPIYDPVTNKSTIIIDSFRNYYKSASDYDNWTDKVDNSREIKIQSNSLVEGSNYIYKFSDEKDFFNNEYKRLTGLNYGEKSIQLSTWASGDVKFELPFNTYVPVKIANSNLIYPKVIDQSIDNSGQTVTKPYKGKGMLTFYNGLRSGNAVLMKSNDDTISNVDSYPFIHHIRYRSNQNFDPLFDLHFASRNYTFDGLQVIPDQMNTFDYYHARFVNEITSQNSKLLSLYLNLDYQDINSLDFSKLKMIDGILYRLNSIKDFDSDAYGTTQVELLKYLG